MGFFDKMKKKAQDAINQAQGAVQGTPEQQQAAQTAPPQNIAQSSGPTFQWDGDIYPLPSGWDGLSIEDWFFKLESVRDEIMRADEMDLPRMQDEDGDDLDPEEVLLISKFGFQHGGHWEAFRNWGVAGWAAQTGESPTDVEFRMGGIAREKIMANKAGAMSGAGGALEPVEGVSCEQWAHIQAKLAGGGDLGQLIAEAGLDPAKWERVSNEWMARMQSDTSMAITTVYGNAFSGAAQGQFGAQAAHAANVGVGGDLGAEPVSFERYVEIMEAQNAAANRGQDANQVLASFGITAMDWGNIGMYWSKKQQQEATKYHALYVEYSEKYSKKYGG
jgi:hypothetical protein